SLPVREHRGPSGATHVLAPVGQVQIAQRAPGVRVLDRDHPPALSVAPARREPSVLEHAQQRFARDGAVREAARRRRAAHGLVEIHAPRVTAQRCSICRSTRAGAPAATENGSMSLLTTLFAPITQRSPTLTPLVTATLAPSQQLSPMRVGPLLSNPC